MREKEKKDRSREKPRRSKNKSIAAAESRHSIRRSFLATFCCLCYSSFSSFKTKDQERPSVPYSRNLHSRALLVWKGPMQQEKAARPFFFVESPSRPWLKKNKPRKAPYSSKGCCCFEGCCCWSFVE